MSSSAKPVKAPTLTERMTALERLLEASMASTTRSITELREEIDTKSDQVAFLSAELEKRDNIINSLTADLKKLMNLFSSSRDRADAKTYAEAAATTKPDVNPLICELRSRKIARDREIHKKDFTVVLIGMPEEAEEDLNNKCMKILGPEGFGASDVDSIFRHGELHPGKERIVKVRLHRKEHQDRVKRLLGRSAICKFARDDLTIDELSMDRQLRRQCREMNENSTDGTKFVVRDLMIYKKKTSHTSGSGMVFNVSDGKTATLNANENVVQEKKQ
ncbi:unnamed protein product [Caenorhabditis auriculariae]|uniref:Uncharacterized protein n=1 Tax=Caenorhabditis auriculariae TaxID=2777116 RepID=A0A8S1GVG5_9PELO|nr:unnamed protein product [Caenorhabditis auriculariae]